jgi:hypothetical protein
VRADRTRSRPLLHLATTQRSMSVTPPPTPWLTCQVRRITGAASLYVLLVGPGVLRVIHHRIRCNNRLWAKSGGHCSRTAGSAVPQMPIFAFSSFSLACLPRSSSSGKRTSTPHPIRHLPTGYICSPSLCGQTYKASLLLLGSLQAEGVCVRSARTGWIFFRLRASTARK